MDISQFFLMIFTCFSIWALAGKRYKLGFILGLFSQPFWFYSAWVDGLWGMFVVSSWVTVNYVRGFLGHYFDDYFKKRVENYIVHVSGN